MAFSPLNAPHWSLNTQQHTCSKLLPASDKKPDYTSSQVFLRLRAAGCPLTRAINFSTKHPCRTDGSQSHDGPRGYKILKTIYPKHPFIFAENGWLLTKHTYSLGPNFNTEIQNQITDQSQVPQKFNQQISYNQHTNEESLTRVKNVNNDYKNLDQKCNFDCKNRQKLLAKLKLINSEGNGVVVPGKVYDKVRRVGFMVIGGDCDSPKKRYVGGRWDVVRGKGQERGDGDRDGDGRSEGKGKGKTANQKWLDGHRKGAGAKNLEINRITHESLELVEATTEKYDVKLDRCDAKVKFKEFRARPDSGTAQARRDVMSQFQKRLNKTVHRPAESLDQSIEKILCQKSDAKGSMSTDKALSLPMKHFNKFLMKGVGVCRKNVDTKNFELASPKIQLKKELLSVRLKKKFREMKLETSMDHFFTESKANKGDKEDSYGFIGGSSVGMRKFLEPYCGEVSSSDDS